MSLNPEPPTPRTLCVPLFPPTERDFEIYHAIQITGSTTRRVAELNDLSQTRVRQIVARVVQWIAEVLPPEADISKEKWALLARHIAADRLQHQLEEAAELWTKTSAPKYMTLLTRITLANARLGVVAGAIDALAADVILDSHPDHISELVTASKPIPSQLQSEISNLKSEISSNPPVEDCSTKYESANAAGQPVVENYGQSQGYDTQTEAYSAPIASSAPLLNSRESEPVTALRITPNQPGVTISPPPTAPQQHQITASLPIPLHSS